MLFTKAEQLLSSRMEADDRCTGITEETNYLLVYAGKILASLMLRHLYCLCSLDVLSDVVEEQRVRSILRNFGVTAAATSRLLPSHDLPNLKLIN